MTNPFAQAANQAPAPQTPAAPAANPAPQAPAAEQVTGQPAPQPKRNLSDMFNNGSTGGGDKLTDLEGSAVLIRANKYVENMTTQHEPANVIEADWIVLDGPRQGEQLSGLIFATVIVNSLRRYLEEGQNLCVGIVARGDAKPGKSAPWLLNPLNEAQLELAGQAVTAYGW